MRREVFAKLVGCVFGVWGLSHGLPAQARIDHAFPGPLLGPKAAKGLVVWSHGRSIYTEDMKSPTPPYLRVLRAAGWDVLRFDRLRDGDTLGSSSRRLARHAAQFKAEGYKRVVLAGQSFGAFLSLMAADQSAAVDAVVATAPAAFGSFQDFYDSWRLNATRLYPVLQQVKRARVMLFFFHNDNFDPGGRGSRSREILAKRGLGYAVVDQPEYFTGHLAASSGLFLRRFGSCISRFIADDGLKGGLNCHPIWGDAPSAELALPSELRAGPATEISAAGTRSSGEGSSSGPAPGPVRDAWYGFYPNGREVLFAIEGVHGDDLRAVYVIGPGIRKGEPSHWVRRTGHIVDNAFVFAGKGQSTLRFWPRPDGSLGATWVAPDGAVKMRASLRRLDPQRFARNAAAD
ncbi:MAG TPA: alpha/beta fold hydrolase [Stellaceae bacterium]|nr:alpha/beta fold hydrolase [Stellaceae bacterium]